MPTRIYDIAKKLGVENKQVLAKAKELGIATAKGPASSLSATADSSPRNPFMWDLLLRQSSFHGEQ